MGYTIFRHTQSYQFQKLGTYLLGSFYIPFGSWNDKPQSGVYPMHDWAITMAMATDPLPNWDAHPSRNLYCLVVWNMFRFQTIFGCRSKMIPVEVEPIIGKSIFSHLDDLLNDRLMIWISKRSKVSQVDQSLADHPNQLIKICVYCLMICQWLSHLLPVFVLGQHRRSAARPERRRHGSAALRGWRGSLASLKFPGGFV